MKLFKVTCIGLTDTGGTRYGHSYVVASDAQSAYDLVRTFLDKENLGFRMEREMKNVELLADESMYPECRHMLFVSSGILSRE